MRADLGWTRRKRFHHDTRFQRPYALRARAIPRKSTRPTLVNDLLRPCTTQGLVKKQEVCVQCHLTCSPNQYYFYGSGLDDAAKLGVAVLRESRLL